MIDKTKMLFQRITNLDSRSIGLIAVAIVALSVTYSSAKIIQKNYVLQQEITKLQQENALQEQINKNQNLKNDYYKTDAYLDIAARRYTNKAAPGERLYSVSKEVALKYVKPAPEDNQTPVKSEPQFIQNWRKWINFLGGKPV